MPLIARHTAIFNLGSFQNSQSIQAVVSMNKSLAGPFGRGSWHAGDAGSERCRDNWETVEERGIIQQLVRDGL